MSFLGCRTPSREEINATTWLNNTPLPAELCEANPELKRYGFYRRLNSGKLEFMSYCKPCTDGAKDCAKNFIAIHENDFQKMLDKYVPENPKR